jgi:hypothetical protein
MTYGAMLATPVQARTATPGHASGPASTRGRAATPVRVGGPASTRGRTAAPRELEPPLSEPMPPPPPRASSALRIDFSHHGFDSAGAD